MKFFILATTILWGLVSGCKATSGGPSSSLADTNSPRSTGYAPATHYALKSGVRRLFESVRMVQSGVEDGAYVYTVTELQFSQFEKNFNGVTGVVLLNLSVDASKSQAVTRRVDAGVNLSFSGQAKVYIDISLHNSEIALSYRGMEWTRPLHPRINTWTNARILRGVVHREARKEAEAAVPGAKRTIISKVEQELRSGISEQAASFRQYFEQIAKSMHDVPGAVPKLSSDAYGAYFQHHLRMTNAQAVVNPPSTPSTVDAGFLFHQQVFTDLLAPNLAGQTIEVNQLSKIVCSSFSKSLYKICQTKPLKMPVDLSLSFAKDRPVNFTFENAAIKMNLRAKIKVSTNDQTTDALKSLVPGQQAQPSLQLLDTESPIGTSVAMDETSGALEKVEHVTPEVEVSVTYSLGNRRFTQSDVKVSITTPESDGGFLTKQTLYREGLVMLLKTKLGESLPEFIDVPAVPAYASSNPQIKNVDGVLVVKQAEHFGIRDNWLYSYFTYCSPNDTQTALGINMTPVKDTKNNPRLRVTKVNIGTPAARAKVLSFNAIGSDPGVQVDYQPAAGLKADDIIYAVDANDQIVQSPELFSGTLAGRSLNNNGVVKLQIGRKEVLQGLDKPVWMLIDYEVHLRKTCKSAL